MEDIGPYRCSQCGNKTRFDVYERLRRRRFAHFDLAGRLEYDEEEVLSHEVDRVVCRWCEAEIDVGEVEDSRA